MTGGVKLNGNKEGVEIKGASKIIINMYGVCNIRGISKGIKLFSNDDLTPGERGIQGKIIEILN